MKLQTQKISREMNCTTKVRSICTDKSMKNSGVHHWSCSACTDEQVNCPFCLLWERCLKPIFPRRISQPYVLEKNQLWKTQKQIILAHWNKELGNEDGAEALNTKQKKSDNKKQKSRSQITSGGQHCQLRQAERDSIRFHRRHQNNTIALPADQSPSRPSTMSPAAHCEYILTASLQMIQKPDVTGFLITF